MGNAITSNRSEAILPLRHHEVPILAFKHAYIVPKSGPRIRIIRLGVILAEDTRGTVAHTHGATIWCQGAKWLAMPRHERAQSLGRFHDYHGLSTVVFQGFRLIHSCFCLECLTILRQGIGVFHMQLSAQVKLRLMIGKLVRLKIGYLQIHGLSSFSRIWWVYCIFRQTQIIPSWFDLVRNILQHIPWSAMRIQ